MEKPASPWYYAGITGGILDTTAVVITPAAVLGQRYFLTSLEFANTGTASEIIIQNTTGTVVLWRGFAPTGGVQTWIAFDPPLQSLPNDTLGVKMITTASATRVSAQGFIDP